MAVRLETSSGTPTTVGDVTVTPWSQALVVRLPFARLVWNRPTAVVVERAGRAERIPVLDVTRVLQLGLLGFTVAVGIATVLGRARRR